MPCATRVVQLAGVPRMPATSTRHSLQDPKASRLSVAHSLGMAPPTNAAARITLVPAGTVTARPSMVSVTTSAVFTGGVPRSICGSQPMISLHSGGA